MIANILIKISGVYHNFVKPQHLSFPERNGLKRVSMRNTVYYQWYSGSCWEIYKKVTL